MSPDSRIDRAALQRQVDHFITQFALGRRVAYDADQHVIRVGRLVDLKLLARALDNMEHLLPSACHDYTLGEAGFSARFSWAATTEVVPWPGEPIVTIEYATTRQDQMSTAWAVAYTSGSPASRWGWASDAFSTAQEARASLQFRQATYHHTLVEVGPLAYPEQAGHEDSTEPVIVLHGFDGPPPPTLQCKIEVELLSKRRPHPGAGWAGSVQCDYSGEAVALTVESSPE